MYACNYYVCMYVCTYVCVYICVLYNAIQYLMFCHAYLHNIYQYPFDVMLYCGIFPHMMNCAQWKTVSKLLCNYMSPIYLHNYYHTSGAH